MINFVNIPHGHGHPLGATYYDEGVNFSIFSKNAQHVELLLFDEPQDGQPSRVIPLNKDKNRTFYYWHIFVEGLKPGQLYGYRVNGPHKPKSGYRFDGSKLLLDPYTRAVANWQNYSREKAKMSGDNTEVALKSVVVDPYDYDWEGDQPISRPYSETIIYELHVKGFTANSNSGVAKEKRGTYAGVIEKIPYLKELGITAVELMPVQQFDEQDAFKGLTNYWGYSPVAFFAPHAAYGSSDDPMSAVNDFRDMVKAFHKAGIEVILDVVFNHTAEGDHTGPVHSFKGLENLAYYMLEGNMMHYKNYAGCGNTFNANHSIVRRMIGDSLRSWVTEYHIDGFRFDLASVLSRDEYGVPLKNPPVLWEIESDPVLSGTKIIAEAWDAAGLYQVGSFIGDRWAEWNGKYRDDIRRFVKGDKGRVSKLASRILGSPDIYTAPDREITRSIHFVTCHDGFTLNDLVSYNDKHNLANGEDNRDGANDNYSWNCGVEGKTNNEEIEALRIKQIKNFTTLTFISQGTPMILMGDEVRQTQNGNNNVYCQDNELAWFDWSLVEKNKELLEFNKTLIYLTQNTELFKIERLLSTKEHPNVPHIVWHGTKLDDPDWSYNSHSLAFNLVHPEAGENFYVMINAFWDELEFEIPECSSKGKVWKEVINTSKSHPNDIVEAKNALTVSSDVYVVPARSIVLIAAD